MHIIRLYYCAFMIICIVYMYISENFSAKLCDYNTSTDIILLYVHDIVDLLYIKISSVMKLT